MDEEVNKNELWDGYRNIKLTEAENIIKSNLNGCVRNFVAIGFYLKDIRDNETYKQGGYESIWDYAKDKLQMAKSTVSRFMAINDKFSVGGNSPVLLDEYKDYGPGKLQEMLTLTNEQLKEVTPDLTVRQIRNMKTSRVDYSGEDIDRELERRISKFNSWFDDSFIEEMKKRAQIKVDAIALLKDMLSSNQIAYCPHCHMLIREVE